MTLLILMSINSYAEQFTFKDLGIKQDNTATDMFKLQICANITHGDQSAIYHAWAIYLLNNQVSQEDKEQVYDEVMKAATLIKNIVQAGGVVDRKTLTDECDMSVVNALLLKVESEK